MSDTLSTEQGREVETRVVLNMGAYRRLTAAKGAKTAEERRRVAGISRTTEYRWKHGIGAGTGRRALAFVRRLEGTHEELFVEVAAS